MLVGTKSTPAIDKASAFAPVNIALVKYWGKRNSELNLPRTSSLSISLPVGTTTSIQTHSVDALVLNGSSMPLTTPFAERLFAFIDLFRQNHMPLLITTVNDIPTGAGLASSASGFAALTRALDIFFGWNLTPKELSILARLGSGSASRSLYSGFVEWHAGTREDGLDSYAERLDESWDELSVGFWIFSDKTKPIDSRKAMQQTVDTSLLYKAWPDVVARDLPLMKEAIATKAFSLLGQTAESNALCMHATMQASLPPIIYFLPETIAAMHTIWQWREKGLEVYFTVDAGPNLKLLFLKKDKETLLSCIPELQIMKSGFQL